MTRRRSADPSRGAHPLAVIPPIVATLVVAGDVTTAQTAWVVGMTGVAAAEVLARAADRREDADGPQVLPARALRWSVPVVPLLLAVAVLALLPALPATVHTGATAGAVASAVVGLLLALPIPSARDLASRPTIWRPRRTGTTPWFSGGRVAPGPHPSRAPRPPGPAG